MNANAVETFTGKFVDTYNPSVEDIVLEDIAHALSSLCRFSGHCKHFYSVAQHAVMVSKRLEKLGHPKHVCFAGLHHDDAEAYLTDIPRPMKPLLQPVYGEMTDRMDCAIASALGSGLTHAGFHAPCVKEADNWALLVEADVLMPSRGINWAGSDMNEQQAPALPGFWLGCQTPVEAEGMFLSRHWALAC